MEQASNYGRQETDKLFFHNANIDEIDPIVVSCVSHLRSHKSTVAVYDKKTNFILAFWKWHFLKR